MLFSDVEILSANELAELVEFGEATACADLAHYAPAALEMSVAPIGDALALVSPRVPIVLFNRVIGLGLRQPATEAQVEEISRVYREAGVRTFAVQISPAAQPAALPAWLATRGLLRGGEWAKVYRPAVVEVTVPTDLRVEVIGPELATEFAQVAATAFGLPPLILPWLAASVGQPGWRHYLAFDGDTAVATAALFTQNGVGWLGIGSTLPAYRRRGGQGALMARRIRDAAALGCRWLVTETGADSPARPNPSYHNMLRTGFALAYLRPNYVSQASA